MPGDDDPGAELNALSDQQQIGQKGTLGGFTSAAHNASADRFLIHARVLESILEHAHASTLRDDEIDDLLDKFGLADVRAHSFDSYVSMDRLSRLSRELGKLLNDPAIGLHQSVHSRSGSIGVVDNAFVTAPNVETALHVLCRYIRLYADVTYSGLEFDANFAAYVWAYSPLLEASDVLADRAAHQFVLRISKLFGESWKPVSVQLQREKPADTAPYVAALGASVTFGATINRIVLDRRDLDRPNRIADPYAHEVAVALANRMLSERRVPDDLSIRAREDIWHHLNDGQATLAETSRRLGTSTRSLQRRLDELGTSYQLLSEDVRRARAYELLTESDIPVGEIAFQLGFSNQANLTRAVKRWFGNSPRQVRNRVKT